ncbi:MAG: OmpA family protein [Streptosporangiales bacterium]|nr:OmpA family protein [Streptosporangiales bacterium]
MTRAALRRGAALAVVAMLVASPGTAGAETPTPTVWKSPGAGAKSARPIPITGTSVSMQERREPLVLIDEKRTGKKRALTLSADVLFAKDSADLGPASNETLDEVAKRIRESGAKGPVEVTGHTDTDGTSAHNLDLSTKRATAVTEALTSRLSGTGTTLKPVGKGETALAVDPERSPADKARNRRVTVTYTTTKDEPGEETEPTDISVPGTEIAPPAKGPEAAGSRAAVERTFTSDEGDNRIQLDVMNVDEHGPFVYVRVRVTAVSLPADSTGYSGVPYLFSGDTTVSDDASDTVLFDEQGGTKLRYYVTGKGEPIRSSMPTSLAEGESADVWFYFTAPEQHRDDLDLYVPAFGTIKALQVKG